MLKITDKLNFESETMINLPQSFRNEDGDFCIKMSESRAVWEWVAILMANIVDFKNSFIDVKDLEIFLEKDDVLDEEEDKCESVIQIDSDVYESVSVENVLEQPEYVEMTKAFATLINRLTKVEGERLTRVLLQFVVKSCNGDKSPVIDEVLKEYDLENIWIKGWIELTNFLNNLDYEIDQNVDAVKFVFEALRNNGYLNKLVIPQFSKLVKDGWYYYEIVENMGDAYYVMQTIADETSNDLLIKEVRKNLLKIKGELLTILNKNYPANKVEWDNPVKFWTEVHHFLYNYMAHKYINHVEEKEQNKLKNVVGKEIEEISKLLVKNLTNNRFDMGMLIWKEMASDLKEMIVLINEKYNTEYHFSLKNLYADKKFFMEKNECIYFSKEMLLNILLLTMGKNEAITTEIIGTQFFPYEAFSNQKKMLNIVDVQRRAAQLISKKTEDNKEDVLEELVGLLNQNKFEIRENSLDILENMMEKLGSPIEVKSVVTVFDKDILPNLTYYYRIKFLNNTGEINGKQMVNVIWRVLFGGLGNRNEDYVKVQEFLMRSSVTEATPMKKIKKF